MGCCPLGSFAKDDLQGQQGGRWAGQGAGATVSWSWPPCSGAHTSTTCKPLWSYLEDVCPASPALMAFLNLSDDHSVLTVSWLWPTWRAGQEPAVNLSASERPALWGLAAALGSMISVRARDGSVQKIQWFTLTWFPHQTQLRGQLQSTQLLSLLSFCTALIKHSQWSALTQEGNQKLWERTGGHHQDHNLIHQAIQIK